MKLASHFQNTRTGLASAYWEMPRQAPALTCSPEVKAKLVATSKSRTEEARAVERARIILACLEGKEIQQVALELRASIPTVSKWRRRFGVCDIKVEGCANSSKTM
jgi:hypothetical protein